jgi:hypothetical protein
MLKKKEDEMIMMMMAMVMKLTEEKEVGTLMEVGMSTEAEVRQGNRRVGRPPLSTFLPSA